MNKCKDCGCILEGNICSNCHEELFIITYQGEDMYHPVSNEFREKANQQKENIKRQKQIEKFN